MAIPNPNPNIADGIKCDNKTYSSNKIESLISAATELPIPEAGDAGKVLTVNAAEDGYELGTPVDPASILRVTDTLTITLDVAKTVNTGTITPILFNYDITSLLPDGATLKAFIVETMDGSAGIARQWISGANKISVSGTNPTGSIITVTSINIRAFYI